MDNNKDKQFYWEVKDFMNRIPSNETKKANKLDIVSSAKMVLEQGKVYKQSSFESQSKTVNIIKDTITHVSNSEKGYDPKSIGYTKNKDVNAFNSLNENLASAMQSGLKGLMGYAGVDETGEEEKEVPTFGFTPEEPETSPQSADRQVKPSLPTPDKLNQDKTPKSDFASARKKYYESQNVRKQKEAEEKLARMSQVDTSKLSSYGKQQFAVNKLKAERAARGEDAASAEDIETRVKKDVTTRERSEREKNIDITSRLASKYLLNPRTKEGVLKTPMEIETEFSQEKERISAASQPKPQTAAKNPPASQTGPKTYRI